MGKQGHGKEWGLTGGWVDGMGWDGGDGEEEGKGRACRGIGPERVRRGEECEERDREGKGRGNGKGKVQVGREGGTRAKYGSEAQFRGTVLPPPVLYCMYFEVCRFVGLE